MFKRIGIVACTAEGAALCYREIVALGAQLNSDKSHPEVILQSYSRSDFMAALLQFVEHQPDELINLLLSSIEKLKKAGADFIIIPANTVHFVIEQVQAKSPLPVLSILDVVASECHQRQYHKVLILGTEWTMSMGLYNKALQSKSIEAVVPDQHGQGVFQQIILDELTAAIFKPQSTASLVDIIKQCQQELHCDAAALACTELPLVLNQQNCAMPVLDTTRLLAQAAYQHAIQK